MTDPTTDQTTDQTTGPTDPSTEKLGYEQAREELLDVVQTLEQGGLTLEETLALWERGERLAQVCQKWLDGARRRLEDVLAERGATEE
jgi:exodeoxyribonuclease VII small subunit